MRASLPPVPLVIVVLGLVQAMLLLLADKLVGSEVRPFTSKGWVVAWYTVVIAVPLAWQLMVTDPRDKRLWSSGLALAAVLAALGVYLGSTLTDNSESIVVAYALTVGLGWYVILPFLQQHLQTGRWRPAYPGLFEHAWNNVLTLIIAVTFTGIFWALLGLWAALFRVIGIPFFGALFSHEYFIYPVTGLVFAFSVYLGRRHAGAVVTVRRVILAIFMGLLPLLSFIGVLFMVALPVMGVEALWATGHATALLVILQILMIVFLNAVYQDGSAAPPYPRWLQYAVRVSVVVLPVYTALSVYAVGLRVAQYGWSVDRVWAALLVAVVGLYIIGYMVAGLRRGVWMKGMASVNVAMAALVVALAVLVNSPVLDPKRIAVGSQVARLLDGRIAAADFDYDYLRFRSGRVGIRALEELKELEDHSAAETIRTSAAQALAREHRWAARPTAVAGPDDISRHLSAFPEGAELDSGFLALLYENRGTPELQSCFYANSRCQVAVVDLNGDGEQEYVLLTYQNRWSMTVIAYGVRQDVWTRLGLLDAPYRARVGSAEELVRVLAAGEFSAVVPDWHHLRIGEAVFRFTED